LNTAIRSDVTNPGGRQVPIWALALPVLVVLVATSVGVAVVVAGRSSNTVWVAPAHARVGGTSPDFTTWDLVGKKVNLSSFGTRPVLLSFWATWCTPCLGEIPHFVAFQNQYREQGLQVIGISMDDGPKPVREFYQKFKMNYPVALGTEKLAEAYGGVLGLPVMFLIGRDGQVAAKYVGEVQMPVLEQEIKSLLQAK